VEEEFVKEAREGDRNAFANLVREHHPRVILLCRSMLGNDAEADDAAQEVFLKTFQKLEEFDGRSRLATWLHRISVNLCLDLLRRRAREKAGSLEGVELSDHEAGRRASDAKEEISALLALLPEDQRTAIILRELQGFSYEEICETTGWTLDSVKARLRRAREKLSEKIRHFEAPPGV